MNHLRTLLRNWWRGYTDEDVATMREKVHGAPVAPGEWNPLTNREMRAYLDDDDYRAERRTSAQA